MKNLEQLRAKNALDCVKNLEKKDEEGNAVSGYPSLVINNGLMAAMAFSHAKGGQHKKVAEAIVRHLAILFPEVAGGDGVKKMLERLADSDSHTLQLCTMEALKFLSYLKRFAI